MNLRRHWATQRKAAGAVTLAFIASAGLAACSEGDSAASGGGDPACVEAADTYMQDWAELPTSLPEGLEPMEKAPEPGTVINLARGNSPADLIGADAMEEAASTAGWEYELLTHDGTPEDTNAKFVQAIGDQPDVITMASIPPEMVANSIKAAEEAGIVVAISGEPTLPESNPGYAANTFSEENFEQNAQILANWALKDSECNVHAVVAPLTLPVLETLADEFKTVVEDTCSECSAKIVPLQPTDIGSPAVVNAIMSAVQADPNVNYVVASLGQIATGLDAALKQAGRTDVKIIGQVPDEASYQSLQAGTSSMWVNYTPTYNSWALLDVALRAVESGETVSGLPFAVSVMTADKLPSDYDGQDLTYPENYQSEFADLWQVG